MNTNYYFFCFLLSSLLHIPCLQAQHYIVGNTFEQRCESMIDYMVYDIEPYTGNLNVKYSSAYHWARLYRNEDTARATEALEAMYEKILNGTTAVTGSDIEFYAHMTMHGYLLCKDKVPTKLAGQVKAFLQTLNFNTIGSVSTLNLDMQLYATGLLAAQEWPDFRDKNNRSPAQITAYNRPRILNTLNLIYHNNCEEMDAFIYLPTDIMYIRMLAEFSKDEEVRQRSYVVYQQMIAAMLGAWNQGMYIANPPRCKGWGQLVAGPEALNSRVTALAWLFFGNPDNKLKMGTNYVSDTNNSANCCFWVAYKRDIKPLQAILDAEKRKTFPYEYHSFINEEVVNRNNGITQNWKYHKYTWQSENYGLATQTEIPYKLSNAASLYTYKEIKRTYLAWKGDSEQCYFSVCQDNPERPTDKVNANAIGYGENPHHRVMQHKGAAMGITHVPTTYLNNNRYMLYFPFSKVGIKYKVQENDWLWCHTGTIMFAFRTVEPFSMPARGPFRLSNCDVYMLDNYEAARKGSWILQVTEITDDLKGETMADELSKFKQKMLSVIELDTLNYSTSSPQLRYKNMDGDVMELTYFPPTADYNGQYKVNGTALLLNTHHFNSPIARQAHKADDVYIYNTAGSPAVLNWNDPAPPATHIGEDARDGDVQCFLSGSELFLYGLPKGESVRVEVHDVLGNCLVSEQGIPATPEYVVKVDKSLFRRMFIVSVRSQGRTWTLKCR